MNNMHQTQPNNQFGTFNGYNNVGNPQVVQSIGQLPESTLS